MAQSINTWSYVLPDQLYKLMSEVLSLPATSPFLSQLRVYDVDSADAIQTQDDAAFDKLAALAVLNGAPTLSEDDESAEFRAAIAFPVFREDKIVSVVAMATEGTSRDDGGLRDLDARR